MDIPALAPQRASWSGLLGWLGLRGKKDDCAGSVAELVLSAANAKQLQLGEIGRFLNLHGLDLTTATLTVAWTYLSRSDEEIGRAHV